MEIQKLIYELMKKRVLLLDGAMGTMIQNLHLTEADHRGEIFGDHSGALLGNNEVLNLSKPGIIRKIHLEYLKAGADIVSTNSINANALSLEAWGLRKWVKEVNVAAAKLAREAVENYASKVRPRFVAGCVGPTHVFVSKSKDKARVYAQLNGVYREQMLALLEGGVDMLLIETMVDMQNANAALDAAEKVEKLVGKDVAVILSFSVDDRSGCLLSGEGVREMVKAVEGKKLCALGLNCGGELRKQAQLVEEMHKLVDMPVVFYPSLGLPDAKGCYDGGDRDYEEIMGAVLRKGMVNIVGGCCGFTIKHTGLLASYYFINNPRAI